MRQATCSPSCLGTTTILSLWECPNKIKFCALGCLGQGWGLQSSSVTHCYLSNTPSEYVAICTWQTQYDLYIPWLKCLGFLEDLRSIYIIYIILYLYLCVYIYIYMYNIHKPSDLAGRCFLLGIKERMGQQSATDFIASWPMWTFPLVRRVFFVFFETPPREDELYWSTKAG